MEKDRVLKTPNEDLLFMKLIKKNQTLFIRISLNHDQCTKNGLQYCEAPVGGDQSLIQTLGGNVS